MTFFFVTLISQQDSSSPSDKSKKQTQDLLHAELTDTLKRRKPMMITELPKYEFSTFDYNFINTNDNNNNTIKNKINDSLHSTSVNKTRPSAVSLALIGIKLPIEKTSQSDDKPKMSHGKPNFTIHHKENKPFSPRVTSPMSPTFHFKALETAQTKLKRPSYFISNIGAENKTPTKPFAVKTTPTVDAAHAEESPVEKCKSIPKIKSQQIIESDTPKSLKCQPKSDVILKIEKLKSSNEFEPIIQTSMDDTTDDLSYESFANRKALFEKPPQDGNVSKILLRNVQAERSFLNKITISPTSYGKMHTFNNNRNENNVPKSNITKVFLNRNFPHDLLEQPTIIDKNNNLEQSSRNIDQTMTINGSDQHESKHIKHKTIVSFSKDLLNAPNNYPEQIRVKNTIITQHSHAIPDNPFNHLRFSIKMDGQVIPKIK